MTSWKLHFGRYEKENCQSIVPNLSIFSEKHLCYTKEMSNSNPIVGYRVSPNGAQSTKAKLLFLNHLLGLPDESLASQITRAQDTNSYPGLIKECRKLLEL